MISLQQVASASIAVIALTVASSAWAAKKPKVEIELREWNVTVSEESVKAGEIEFSVKNKGKETHEVAIIKLNTNEPVGRLPIDKHGAIDEATMTFGKIIDEFEGLDPGKKDKKTIVLKPGRYAIVCNMVEKEKDGTVEAHYSMGMSAQLMVE